MGRFMVLGHISATFLIVKLRSPRASKAVMAAALVGGYFPDILDKGSVKILDWGTERGMAHTLVFQIVLLMFGWLAIKSLPKYTQMIQWFIAGSCLHLVEDLVRPSVLFWPFLGGLPPPSHYDFWQVFKMFYLEQANFPVLVLEMISHGALLVWLTIQLKRRAFSHEIL